MPLQASIDARLVGFSDASRPENDLSEKGLQTRARLRQASGMAERTLRVFDEGKGEYLAVDPDGFRDATGRKSRKLVSKLVTARDAVARLVADGDYLVWECNYLQRGPSILIRELVRQRKQRL